MNEDNSQEPEFVSWKSYYAFAQHVRCTRRYVWQEETRGFLATVLATTKDREIEILKGKVFLRAQRGVEYETITDEAGMEQEMGQGYCATRMKPLLNRASAGRANPAGIPVLYLASSEKTAVSEVRPWVGSEVSVGHFEILRNLKALDLSRGRGDAPFGHLTLDQAFGNDPVDANAKKKAVWIAIDNAFSQPVTASDDEADYVPTQILVELFKDAGYDAIIYRSQLDDPGYNIALFDIGDAKILTCAPHRVTAIEVTHEKFGRRWHSKNTRSIRSSVHTVP